MHGICGEDLLSVWFSTPIEGSYLYRTPSWLLHSLHIHTLTVHSDFIAVHLPMLVFHNNFACCECLHVHATWVVMQKASVGTHRTMKIWMHHYSYIDPNSTYQGTSQIFRNSNHANIDVLNPCNTWWPPRNWTWRRMRGWYYLSL